MRNRIMLLTDCREGACGTCRAVCDSGDYDLEDYSADALSERDRADGAVLTCRMRLNSDCVVTLDYASTAAIRGPAQKPHTLELRNIERIAEDAVELVLASEDGKALSFLPGQYVNLSPTGSDFVRSYSFSNAPGSPQANFLVRLLPGGAMSTWLLERAKPGDVVAASGPFGRFFLRDTNRPLLFVAGGTGLAPIMSMLESMAAEGVNPPGVDVIFGVGQPQQLMCLDSLGALVAKFANSSLTTTVVEPDATWDKAVGTTADALAAANISAGTQVYLCGPGAMIDACAASLDEKGISQKDRIFEVFVPAEEK